MALIDCPDCGKQVSDQAKACPSCARPLITEVVVPKEIKVVEFQRYGEYVRWLRWLQRRQGKVNVVSVATTKRWGWTLGFLGRAKTYTVTYELMSTKAGKSSERTSSFLVIFIQGIAAIFIALLALVALMALAH